MVRFHADLLTFTKIKNTVMFRVGDDFRKNPLSLTPGGHDVVVVWQDGASYLYDNVKAPKKYVSSISKKPSKHGRMVEVRVDNAIVWKRNDAQLTISDWADFE